MRSSMAKGRAKKYTGTERRRWPRFEPKDLPFLKSVAFSQGGEVQVINISQGGMLLETERRLQPKMKVQLRIDASSGAFDIEGQVLRSSITSIQGAPRYQSAIAFKYPIHMLLDNVKADPAEQTQKASSDSMPPPASTQNGDKQSPPGLKRAETKAKPATRTAVANDPTGLSFSETFDLNEW